MYDRVGDKNTLKAIKCGRVGDENTLKAVNVAA